MTNTPPFVSVIVLNYFGERVLPETLNSLLRQDYPKNRYEIIVVDNHSTDGSKSIILRYEKRHKKIRHVFLGKNAGFSAGNNAGIKMAKGQYVALLNNDCVADEKWLTHLVETAERDTRIFAVNSRIMLYPRFFKMRIRKIPYCDLKEIRLVGSSLLRFSKKKCVPVFYQAKDDEIDCSIPYEPGKEKKIKVQFVFLKKKTTLTYDRKGIGILNFSKSTFLVNRKRETERCITYTVELDTSRLNLEAISHEKIQNAGILVFQDGYGRDIGAKVRYQTQDYEINTGQYGKEKEVYAACGAAVMYRKDILLKLGMMNESFFMYYEDVDISERARLAGYTVMYSPKAIVRHLHALSSVEWSPFFMYHAERGRLLHLFFNFPFSVFLKEYVTFTLKAVFRFIREPLIFSRFSTNIQYLLVSINLFILSLYLIRERLRLSKNVEKRIAQKVYEEIQSGYWYGI